LAGNAELLVHNSCGTGVNPYEVGTYKDLKDASKPSDKLDIHHAVQKHPAGQTINGYDPKNGPSIAVPRSEHIKIPTQKGTSTLTPRSQLAKDITDLRKNTNAPNSSLQQLIELNKKMYPQSFKKQ
jgi:hypothetical protein